MVNRTPKRRRPAPQPDVCRADYIQALARYTGVSVPRHIFVPSFELEAILEHLANVNDEFSKRGVALEKIAKHRLRGRKTQGALIAEAVLSGVSHD